MDTSPNPKSPDPSVFFRPLCISLAIFVAIAISLVSYHIILVRYCVRRQRRMADAQSSPIFQRSERASIGVEEHVLHKIPIIFYTNNCTNLADLDQNECVVCLGELEEGEKVRSLPNCGHLFHVPCIDDWLSAHTNCPICRTPIIIPTSSAIDFSSVLEESATERREIVPQNVGQRDEEGNNSDGGDENRRENENVSSNLATEMVSRQSLSLVLPREKPQSLRVLKRSLSMDQCFVKIDLQNENEDNVCASFGHHSSSASSSSTSCSSTSSSSSSNNYLKEFLANYRTYCKGRTSRQQVDQVSSRLLRSFSQMRSMPNETALPC